MSELAESERLLMRYLDGQLSGAEASRLSTHLRASPELRETLREIAVQAGAMGELARIRALQVQPAEVAPLVVPRRRTWLPSWQALAAALVLGLSLVVIAGLWRNRSERPVVSVASVVGDLAWSGVAGQHRDRLGRGHALPAGTFETIGEGSLAELTFADGTVFMLGGNTRLALAERGQKRAVLFAGALSADVKPQPPGRPLVVETKTAVLEVLGTTFVVSADSNQTTLNVDHGRVRLRRVADGESVDVPAQHAVRASFETRDELAPEPVRMPASRWSLEPAAGPREGVKGAWFTATDRTPAGFAAVPLLQGNRRNSLPVVHHGIGVRQPWQPNSGAFVTLTPASVVRLRYRLKTNATLVLFFVTHRPGGQFAGNFEYQHRPADVTPDRDGWVTVMIPLAQFSPLVPWHRSYQPGNAISYLSVRTSEAEPQLEVSELAIEPAR